MSAFWEPRALQPGDLAVIRISPECGVVHLGWRGVGGFESFLRGRDWTRRRLNGAVVRVVLVCRPDPDDPLEVEDGHDFYVQGISDPLIDDFLAACELEPVEVSG